MKPRKLPGIYWIREGDCADYEPRDSIEDLNLGERDLGSLAGWVRLGFTSHPNYLGNNYVSLFFEDATGQNYDLTDEEKHEVEHKLRLGLLFKPIRDALEKI